MFKVVILGNGDMLANLIIGAKDAHCKIAGIFRYERLKHSFLYRKLKDFFLPSKEYSYIKSYGLPEIKSKSANSEEFKKEILKLNPDFIIVGTWPEKLKREIIQLPKIATINVHPSLLPKYRGPNPYLQTILHCEQESGITFHLMNEKYDAGPILLQKTIKIEPEYTGKELKEQSVLEARRGITELLNMIADDFVIPVDQNENAATYFPQVKNEDIMLDFTKSAKEIYAKIKAFHPWGKTYFAYKNKFISPNPYSLEILDNNTEYKTVGQIIDKNEKERSVTVLCRDGKLLKMSKVRLYGFWGKFFTKSYIKNRLNINDFIS